MTKVENSHFTMQLPDGWEERANADGVEWVTPDGAQQVIVSVVMPKVRTPADLRQALETLMTVRQTQFAKLAGATGQLLPTGIQAETESLVATMVGADVARGVFTFVRIVATPARIVTASFFQYGAGDPKDFVARSEEISSTLTVSTESPKRGWQRFLPW